MELLVLGRDANDKGHQLERVTCDLLAKLGYRNVAVRTRGLGGQEIDVQADHVYGSLSGARTVRVVCECKAYRGPVGQPEWLKFLGKLFVEIEQHPEARGCFIAPSGVAGTVLGQHDGLPRLQERVELVSGGKLVDLLLQWYSLSPPADVLERLKKITERIAVGTALCYRDGRIYYLIQFSGGGYALLDGSGTPLPRADADLLCALVDDAVGAGEHVDLEQEAAGKRHKRKAEKALLSGLLVLDTRGAIADVLERWRSLTTPDEAMEIGADDLLAASDRLVRRGLLRKYSDDSHELCMDEARQVAALLLEIIDEFLWIEVLMCEAYTKLIDVSLLDHVLETQGGLPLSDEDRRKALKLLRWSPQALYWALRPDPMLVTHRQKQPMLQDDRVDKADRSYFFGKLFRQLEDDFNKRPLERYFFEHLQVRELDVLRRANVKGAEGILETIEVRDRLGIGELADQHGGGFIRIRMLEQAPEPWEMEAERKAAKEREAKEDS